MSQSYPQPDLFADWDDLKTPAVRTDLETDEELRARLFYVTGERALGMASGTQLDEIAYRYNLKRRKVNR